ncbi:E3 ubiquitin-protein ligase RNF213-like [Aquila chrysaetos chrysaetos]|uniref:E3 ubiquitin-protein ligase RNF213-like n=1 Tax=Aquila chrysaetos chrysaetos TaxID=223781 RepID=UPI001B7D3C4B|nr:E3 ubiquitin-protein ligase RNF213-like [Aquila chrysaetos chrysaetos]
MVLGQLRSCWFLKRWKGVKECKSCLREITDPAELPCSHIFCTRCILEWTNKQCKICKEEFPEDYTPMASEATRFNNVKVHLEEYLSQMEEKIISNQSNRDHFYFMVVHCPGAADPNAPAAEGNEKEQDLVNAMKRLVAKAQTPWPQVFLIRNLCDICGLSSMWKILQPVLRQMENILRLPSVPDELLEDKLRKIMDALGDSEDPGLLELVFHAALVLVLFPSRVTHLFRNICFKPDVVKGSYLPTMPGDLLFDEGNWKIGTSEKIWTCRCGSYWIVTHCGLPMEMKKCKCGAIVGGANHKPEAGFTQKEITKDKTEKGYVLESPGSRRNELERCLSPACVGLVRALLHSSLLLGIHADKQSKPEDVEEFFWGHLRKDVACLAEALGRNTEDAVLTVHLFLRHLSNDSLADESAALSVLREKKDREEWETSFKALAQPFFQELEQTLNSVKEQRMNEGPHGSSVLLKIAYGQTPPFQDLPRQGLINQPCMWRFEQKMTIQTLMHFLQQEDRGGAGNPYPILLELLSKLENISHVRHLPDIFRLQNSLIHFFQNSHKGEKYTVRQFLDQPELSEDQRLAFSRAIETIKKVWSNIKMNPASSGITVLPDLSPNDINVNTAVLHLLPTQPSISHLVTTFLIQLQNNCIDTAAQVTRERQRSISAEEVKPSSVLAITKSDLVTMALTNLQYEIDEDGTKRTYFDFQMLQRQVVHRFISGKPLIKAQTAPSVALNNVRTLQATKMKVRDQVPQEPLSINQQKRIMEEARSVNALSKTLATLKVAAEFLAVTGGHPECPLPEYVRQELKMDAAAKQFQDLPVVPNARLKHILALWQVLAARRSMLLVQMNQDPFCLVPKEFQGQLEASEAKALASALSNTNLDLFLIELHEMIAVALSGYQPEHELKDAFMFFLEVKEFPTTTVDTLTDALDPGIPVGKILSVWRTAAKTSQINVPAYGQERPAQGSR